MLPYPDGLADDLTQEFHALAAAGGDGDAQAPDARARVRARRRQYIDGHLYEHEKDWRFSPGDGGTPHEVSELAMQRELFLDHRARAYLLAAPDTPDPPTSPAFDLRVEALKQAIKYFPVLFLSAPHLDSEISGSFPGIPTPLLYATAVLDRHLRIDEFPAFRVPDVVAVMNPPVYDEQFERQLDAWLIAARPRVVGISNLSEGHHFALRIARRVKTWLPDALVILGGSHEDGTNPAVYRRAVARARTRDSAALARGVPRPDSRRYDLSDTQIRRMDQLQTLATEEDRELVDFVAAGDCPYLVMELMTIVADNLTASSGEIKRLIAERRERFATLEGSGYLFFHDPRSDAIEHVRLSGRPLDRNALPFIFPGRLTRENRFPVFHGKLTAQVMACVGCKYTCAFCFESADQVLYEVPKLQPRDPENVVKELEILAEMGFEAVFFDDSTFTQHPAALGRLLDLMIGRTAREARPLEWGCQTTINDVSPALLKQMAAAGCTYVYFGLESAHPRSPEVQKASQLQVITKEHSWADRFTTVVGWCHDAGIRVGTSVQFGLQDTPEQRERTIALVAELCRAGFIAKQSVALNVNTPYPGTDQWLELMKEPDRPLPDYRDRLRRHPGFETAHQFSSLPYDAADRLYALAVERLGEAIVGVETGATIPAHS